MKGFTNKTSVIGKVGEDLEKELEREFENRATQVNVDQNSGPQYSLPLV